MPAAEQEGAAVPAAQKGSWSGFIKQLASFNGDLSTMTAPAWILSTSSLTEFSAYWAEMPKLLVAPAAEQDPQKRMCLVLKWFLSTLKQQYASRNEKLGSEKKPLNPFLGELFLGKWEDESGETQLVSEQVSHHPPVTAYSVRNEKHGVRLEGYNAQKASFGRTIYVKQVGHALLHLDKFNETYLITLPSLHIEGIIGGKPYVELDKSNYIVSSSGYTARIDYSGAGWVSGSPNRLNAVVFPHGKEKSKSSVLYTAEGSWTDKFTIKDANKKVVEEYNAKTEPKAKLQVADIKDQDPLESRRAWKTVADAILKGDMNATSVEKTKIEEHQRAQRKKEQAEGRDWDRTFFTKANDSLIFEQLIKEVPSGSLEKDQTGGIWCFDEQKAKAAKSPYNALSKEIENGCSERHQQPGSASVSGTGTGTGRNPTPIHLTTASATSSAANPRPAVHSQSPSRTAFSPTRSSFNPSSVTASRQVTSRHSSTSSNSSYISPSHATATAAFHQANRPRNVASLGSPRLAPSIASLNSVSGGSVAGGITRLARHSPSLSLSTSAGSPVSSTGPHSASSSGQLGSLVLTQLNILLSTINQDTDQVKWEAQAEKIRKLIDESGMELFTTYFRRLLQSNAGTIFAPAARAPTGGDAAGNYQLLIEEMHKVIREPQQADKVAQSLDTSEGELYRDFDLNAFIDHFRLDPVAKIALVLPCRAVNKVDLRAKADAILSQTFQSFLSTLATPQPTDPDNELSPSVLAAIVDRLLQEPPRNWGEEQRENLFYAIRVRYSRLNMRVPPEVESAMLLDALLASPQDSRLAKRIQQAGPRVTSSLDACKDILSGVETRDISYPQIANVLLFMVITQNGDAYDPGIFIEAVRQHKAGARLDWTDVVSGFDKEHLRVTKKQFLALYNALVPLANEYANFDIQSLWGPGPGGQPWQYPETQLSFVVAFLSTTPEELDVMTIPNLQQAFDLRQFATASEKVKAYAEQAIKHPLVSMQATRTLFEMIFRTQESYNMAQMLGIPENIINRNMTVFVCAASAVPKPWQPLQEQALKQLFYPFLLKQHDNYEFVMHALWQHDKSWVATRMVEFYNQDQNLLILIYQHADEHGWLEQLFTLTTVFAVDLATYAHGKGKCDLEEWAQQHVAQLGPIPFARAVADFLNTKIEDESQIQRDHAPPKTVPMKAKTVHALLSLIQDAMPPEYELGGLFRRCLQSYPRLFNYGQDDKLDAIIEANGEQSNVLSDSATKDMEEKYKEMYGGQTNPDTLVNDLNRLKVSEEPADQELFAAMLFGLFEEYNCFGEYPNEALATTAVLFGGLVSYHVLSGVAEQAAIFMIFEAVTEFGPEDPMYRFGLQALLHVLPRLKEWPHLADRILQTPSLRGTPAVPAAENVLKELHESNTALNGEVANGITNGIVEEEFGEVAAPTFSAIQVDPPLRENFYEDPDEDVSDKIMFVLNNVSKRNLDEKFKEIEGAVEEKYHSWFAHYLVEELAKSQPNFQSLYLQILDNFNQKMLWAEVLRETYMSCQKMLNAQSTMDNPQERTTMKNLAGWLGSITLARNQPILHRNLSFKDLLLEAQDNGRLLVAIPFTCKTLVQAAQSKVFRPPNPWIAELLGLLSELYHCMDLKLNMKFEIEMLCREFGLDIKSIDPLDTVRSRPVIDQGMLQNYLPDGPDAFGDMALMGLAKRGPNERFSPEAVISAVPDLGNLLQIPQPVGSITQQQMRNIFVNASQQAIYEIIAPVVERSVTIASISTAELIQKDFITEGDVDKMRNSAHTVVKALSGSLALVTCKEPLRMSITNNIRIMASRGLPDQLPEGQILMFVNDNIDIVCSLVEQAAENHSLNEIDLQLQQALDQRRQHAQERPDEPFAQTPVSRWATLIPDPYRQDQNGLNRQQLSIYEEFGRQARIPAQAHGNQGSQDGQGRPAQDVLSDIYMPQLTPAETPAMPRNTQSQRLQGRGAQQVNGFIDPGTVVPRIFEVIQEIQQATREAPEDHAGELSDSSPVRHLYGQILGFLDAVQQYELYVPMLADRVLNIIFTEASKKLETEILARLLQTFQRAHNPVSRQVITAIINTESDIIFNANAITALSSLELLEPPHIDAFMSKAFKQRRMVALACFRDVLDEMLLRESALALRAEMVLSYEALGQWLVEEPQNELAREVISRLQRPANQVNGMPSPESDTSKATLQEYIFEEWVTLQRRGVPVRSHLAFVQQLHEKKIIAGPEDALDFVRHSLEYSIMQFNAESGIPYASQDKAYVAIDAFARLIMLIVMYQAPSGGEPVNKPKSLEAMIRLIVLVMADHHNKQREHWNGRVYFRLFSSLLVELNDHREQLTPEQTQDAFKVFATTLQVLQPRYFSGFLYHWLALLSHRLLVPAFISPTGRANGGWNTYVKLLTVLFDNLGELLLVPEVSPVAIDFYRGIFRFMISIEHDFPEFLVENHMQLNASIPLQCLQLRNIINNACPRALAVDQPDPFTSGLKINRLEQVRQAPTVHCDTSKMLEEATIKPIVDKVIAMLDLSDEEFGSVLAVVDREDGHISSILINALVLHIGIHATSASSVFSSAASPAKLLERLIKESRAEARYNILSAMANQVRFVNSHTHYFSTALQHIFGTSGQEVQEQILRILCERVLVPRPHPWGIIVMLLEMLKNPNYGLWDLPWIKASPSIESLLLNLAQGQEQRAQFGGRSPLAGF
ncbi:General negative regulator of transcription subunit 1 [Pseudocercospora fuligena]|uniref:General negative regulator of transcription subunit 1 n=1 Tax=Pseudocercospora fuligena TaxID=685502 RepID=A0A8H6RCN2_9PEZI|nr:General negative regulator of transcription subunit 1 [Pseudocercospora fuligena]